MEFDEDLSLRHKLLHAAQIQLRKASTFEEIVATIQSAARGALSADGVTFVLRDHGLCHYLEEDAIGPLWKGQKFPMETCISGWCMLNGKTAAIEDVFADPRIPHDVYRRTFVKSLVMSPVSIDTPVAAIGAYWQDKQSLSEAKIKAVETLAASVANAWQRAQAA